MAPKNPRMNNVDAASAKSAVATEAVPATIPTNAKSAAATPAPMAGDQVVVVVLNPEVAQLKAEIARLTAKLADVKSKAAAEKDAAVAEKDAAVAEKDAAVARAIGEARNGKAKLKLSRKRIKALEGELASAHAVRETERQANHSRVLELQEQLSVFMADNATLEQLLATTIGFPADDPFAWYDPAQFVLRFRPGWSHSKAAKFVRRRLAQLGIDCHNFRQHPGWAKQSGSKYSRWRARQQALVRDLLPVLGH